MLLLYEPSNCAAVVFPATSSLASAGKIFMRCMYMWQTCSAACFMDCKEHCFELFGLVMRYCRLVGWHRQVSEGGREKKYENESFLLLVVAYKDNSAKAPGIFRGDDKN